MIEKEKINAIKRTVDIKSLIESKGIRLKKNGKGYFGRCPFHDDKTPSLSVNTKDNLWQCFGCDKGGDVIRFVELFDQVDFKQAVQILDTGTPDLKTVQTHTDKPDPLPEPKVQQLLERVVMIYEKNFDDIGKKYLYDRGITDAGLFERHRVGYCTGKLKEILPSKGDILKDLKKTGILNQNNGERFSGCLAFPVFD
ncbi:MAG: hypothetical protein HF978_21680 [Desulfobacteraceae bacterium]|nr:hypothetical protein [Desulfobacteraceae bacterium]MBC2758158.1 hypothetical protein [Desulfobacteraceae bacterium]